MVPPFIILAGEMGVGLIYVLGEGMSISMENTELKAKSFN
jgi:hypothetical protein